MTAARPMLSWLTSHEYGGRVAIEDVTDDYAMLAVQGPRSRDVLAGLVPEVDGPVLLRARRGQAGEGAGHGVPHRLHRRPRLRADRPGRRRARRPRRRPRGRPAPRAAPVRRGGADDAAHRGRAAAHRRGVARQPHGLDRPRPGHAEGARSGLDAQGRARPQPPLRRQRGDPPRAARRHVALGDHRDRRRLGRLGPPLPRRRRAAHQGRAGARLGAVAARRRPTSRSATSPASATRRCSSATSAWRACGPSWPRPAPACTWRRRCTTARTWSP